MTTTHTTDRTPPAPPVPPPVTCPPWCAHAPHDWEPDGDGFQIDHDSGNLAPEGAGYELGLYRVDYWHDGQLETSARVVVVEIAGMSTTLEVADLQAVLTAAEMLQA